LLEPYADRDPNSRSSSERLIVAAILQQLAARLDEVGQSVASSDTADLVLSWLPRANDTTFDDFEVSEGISWKANRVQRDIVDSIRSHAIAAKASAESFDGSTWVQVVRSRTSWVDLKMDRRDEARDALVLRDTFEADVEATSRTRSFMRDTAVDRGYDALLIAELSGHSGRIRNARESLGKIVFLSQRDQKGRAREAIRLLRQAGATKPLKSALSWVRSQGPVSDLRLDAELVLRRTATERWATEADLAVLDFAADFLDRAGLQRGIDSCLIYSDGEDSRGRSSWSVLDLTWKTIARLVPGSDRDDSVAALAGRFLHRPAVLTRPFTDTLARVVAALNWSSVSDSTKSEWSRWLEEAQASVNDLETRELREAILASLDPDAEPTPSTGIELAAQFADGLITDSDGELWLQAKNNVLETLAAESANAHRGMYSFGGYSAANVAVAFAFRFQSDDVWQAVANFLTDPELDSVLKDPALDRIAARPGDVPPETRLSLASGWLGIVDGARDSHRFFSEVELPVNAPAIRAGAALGIVNENDAMRAVIALASASENSRVEAAKTIGYVFGLGDSTWGLVLLLQLSSDRNPEVRAAAGHSLVLGLAHAGDLHPLVHDRIDSLMREDGVRTPLSILHAIQRLSAAKDNSVMELREEVMRLTSEQSPRVVRGAALEAIERLGSA
jgi:hypothetical protein